MALGQSGSEDWRFLRIGVVDLLGSSDVSESLSLVDGLDQQIALATPGSENATYEWYRDGTKFATTSEPSVPVTSFSPAQSGAYKVIIREPTGATRVVSLMVKVTGLTYESWLRHKEGPSATPADPGLDRLASARNDGTENILKYAFGKGPNESANEVLPQAMWTGAGPTRRLAIKFRRILDPSDITIRVEASGNLSNWRDVTAELVPFGFSETYEDGVCEEVVFQCPFTLSQEESNNWRYLRVAVMDPTSGTPTVLVSDDFNDGSIDTAKWLVSGNTVAESEQIMKVLATVTDQWGTLTSKPIPLASSGSITITRNVKLHSQPYAWVRHSLFHG